ncbi:STAS/SEC14 domain-containing protein [Adhaeribacter terreus]|uniref:STAS/SEC14 domain-containing protein n=1 Tax=Adhaeribacter terreus TaxID=529703 RepID=A0ABW0E7D4_9BACT
MDVQIPTDRPTFEGEIATYWFDDNGILVSLSKSIKRTVANISGNVAFVKRITNNQPVPLLIYLKNSPVPDKATRKLSTEKLPEIYSAMAMVSEPGLASFIMKILFKFKPSPIPMKNFTSEKEATAWLKQFLPQPTLH